MVLKPVAFDAQLNFVWKNGKEVENQATETRVMTFQSLDILTDYLQFCPKIYDFQMLITLASVAQFSTSLPFFHTKFNCASNATGFKTINPVPAKIRIFPGQISGFHPAMPILYFFLDCSGFSML